jgi:hypothetical protein
MGRLFSRPDGTFGGLAEDIARVTCAIYSARVWAIFGEWEECLVVESSCGGCFGDGYNLCCILVRRELKEEENMSTICLDLLQKAALQKECHTIQLLTYTGSSSRRAKNMPNKIHYDSGHKLRLSRQFLLATSTYLLHPKSHHCFLHARMEHPSHR